MLRLLTGRPGAGKSLWAVQYLYDELKKNRESAALGKEPLRNFFSNIAGLNINGVMPAPDDWRTTPPGSVVVYDEAHRTFSKGTKQGRAEDVRLQDLDQHRHDGYDITLITQSPAKIHQEVLDLVGEHIHFTKSPTLKASNLRVFSRVQMDPYAVTVQVGADKELWPFPQDCFKFYKSAEIHTKSHTGRRIPKVYFSILAVMIVLAVLVFGSILFVRWKFGISDDSKAPESKTHSQLSDAVTPPDSKKIVFDEQAPLSLKFHALSVAPVVPQVLGCIDSSRGCRCWNQDGRQLDLTLSACRSLVDGGLPINLKYEYATPQSFQPAPNVQPESFDEPPSSPETLATSSKRPVHPYGYFRGDGPGSDPVYKSSIGK
jgi:zona occludens toxin